MLYKKSLFIFLILAAISIPASAADTLVFQEGLKEYKGTSDAFVERGYYVASHAKNGTAQIIEIGAS